MLRWLPWSFSLIFELPKTAQVRTAETDMARAVSPGTPGPVSRAKQVSSCEWNVTRWLRNGLLSELIFASLWPFDRYWGGVLGMF